LDAPAASAGLQQEGQGPEAAAISSTTPPKSPTRLANPHHKFRFQLENMGTSPKNGRIPIINGGL